MPLFTEFELRMLTMRKFNFSEVQSYPQLTDVSEIICLVETHVALDITQPHRLVFIQSPAIGQGVKCHKNSLFRNLFLNMSFTKN